MSESAFLQPEAVPGLDDLTVFITGEACGLDLEIARHLVRAGTQRIGLIATDVARGQGAAEEIRSLASGVWALFAPADVTRAADVQSAAAELESALGDADVVIHCASAAGLDEPTDLPAGGLVTVSQAVVDEIRRQDGGPDESHAEVAHHIILLVGTELRDARRSSGTHHE